MKRRNTMGTARALDPTRARRASQAAAVGQVAGAGMGVDPSGRLESKLGEGFFQDGSGVWQTRLGFLLKLDPGSPKRVAVDEDALMSLLSAYALDADLEALAAQMVVESGDIDGGEAATWLGPDALYTASVCEPLEELDGGSA